MIESLALYVTTVSTPEEVGVFAVSGWTAEERLASVSRTCAGSDGLPTDRRSGSKIEYERKFIQSRQIA
jgi:hypothetical protein